jgi:hypothetical protein
VTFALQADAGAPRFRCRRSVADDWLHEADQPSGFAVGVHDDELRKECQFRQSGAASSELSKPITIQVMNWASDGIAISRLLDYRVAAYPGTARTGAIKGYLRRKVTTFRWTEC